MADATPVTIDEDLCLGARSCQRIAPEAFLINDLGIAEVTSDASNVDIAKLSEAADTCPNSAITLNVSSHEE